MKSYYKITLILLLSAFIAVFFSPVIASIIPFHMYRIMSRVVIISTFILFLYYKDRLGILSIKSLGFEFNKRWALLFIIGLVLSLISICIAGFFMLHLSIRFVIPNILNIDWVSHIIKFLITALFVAFFEECLFRGFIFQSLLKDTKIWTAIFLSNIFYSIVHFLKPELIGGIRVLDLANSIKAVPLFFSPLFLEFQNIWPSAIGLFLVGVVLSLAYIRTKSLALSIGLHSGWILGIKSLSLGTDVSASGSIWVSGDITANPIGWIVILFLILIFVLPSPIYAFRRFIKTIRE